MYAPLNIKTCNSLLKSMININDLVKDSRENIVYMNEFQAEVDDDDE